MTRLYGLAILLGVFLLGCSEPEEPEISSGPVRLINAVDPDPHSYSNPHEFLVTHLDLDLTVDFDKKILVGDVAMDVTRKDSVASSLVLDTRDIDVTAVKLENDTGSSPLEFYFGDNDPILGRPLSVDIPVTSGDDFKLVLSYRTSPSASGLQWLSPAQTAGKNHPFLFTQSQAIHARSWIPLQDTPGVRVTYDANITTPETLRAVMSAENDPDAETSGKYAFSMPQPIPSYLIALAVGDLEFAPMGDVTGVYAEPSVLAAATAEFADTEEMLRVTEGLYGEYSWGRYDLLILPPSFPFGGMENPRLSFITPTVIAGDKSLVSLIAHELAHSWSGNLVSNATWRDLWLNEGFTSYVTSRIMEEVYGRERALMEDALSVQSLKKDLESLSEEDQLLAIDLTGRDPDEVFSEIPYTKGQLMLLFIESKLGRQEFDEFLRQYFADFAFKSISTDQFIDYAEEHLVNRSKSAVSKKELESWIFESGLPKGAIIPESDAFAKVAEQSSAWIEGATAVSELNTEGWTVHEWLHFLNNLPSDLTVDQMLLLDETFALSTSSNDEIRHVWLLLSIKHEYQKGLEGLSEYLVRIGRRKLIVPLYEELAKTEAGTVVAEQIYAAARPGYHPLAVQTIDEILK